MRVVIDTNVICRDFHMDGSTFRVFRSKVEQTGHRVFVPVVVVEEVVNKYSEQLQGQANKLENAIRNLEQHARIDIERPMSFGDIEKLKAGYRDELTKKLLSISTPIDYPSVSHEEMVRRALERRRPFQPSGKGYRDALIWENVLDLAASDDPEPIALISENSDDFASEKSSPSELHPNLIEDLDSKGEKVSEVVLFPNLGAFVEEQIKPHLLPSDEIRDQLQGGTYPRLDLLSFLQKDLDTHIGWMEFDAYDLGIYMEVQTANFSYLEKIERLDVTDVRKVDEGELLIEVNLEGEVYFDIFIPKHELYGLQGDEQIHILDSDWNKWYALASTPLNAELGLRIIFNELEATVSSVEVTSVEPLEEWWSKMREL